MITANGEIHGVHNVLEEEDNFYQNLYSSKLDTDNINDWTSSFDEFIDLDDLHITDVENETLTAPLTEDALLSIVKSCDNDKSPGTDGLTKEFYLPFLGR